jgi:hypothetical protein
MSNFKTSNGVVVGSNGVIFSDQTTITTTNYIISNVNTDVQITANDNRKVLICNNSLENLLITLPSADTVSLGFNFKIYLTSQIFANRFISEISANTISEFETTAFDFGGVNIVATGSDVIRTGYLTRSIFSLDGNVEVIKIANNEFAIFEYLYDYR